MRTKGSNVQFLMFVNYMTTSLCCHLWKRTKKSYTKVPEKTSPWVQLSDLFHVMDLGLQHETMLFQLVDFI